MSSTPSLPTIPSLPSFLNMPSRTFQDIRFLFRLHGFSRRRLPSLSIYLHTHTHFSLAFCFTHCIFAFAASMNIKTIIPSTFYICSPKQVQDPPKENPSSRIRPAPQTLSFTFMVSAFKLLSQFVDTISSIFLRQMPFTRPELSYTPGMGSSSMGLFVPDR